MGLSESLVFRPNVLLKNFIYPGVFRVIEESIFVDIVVVWVSYLKRPRNLNAVVNSKY